MSAERGLVCLVTGGGGFLGKHLVEILIERGHEFSQIRIFDLKFDSEISRLESGNSRVILTQGDVTNCDEVFEAVSGANVVFHLASLIDISGRYPEAELFAVNVQGTQRVIDACLHHDVRTLIYTSSMDAVGPNSKWETFYRGSEETVYDICHSSTYAKTKYLAENLITQANGEKTVSGYPLNTCALRPLGIFGEGCPVLRAQLGLARRCGGRLFRLGPPSAQTARVYVGNVAWMHLLASRALRRDPGLVGGEAYFCYDDSPDRSHLDLSLELLGPAGVSVVGQCRPVLPFGLVYLLALLLEALSFLLRPFYPFYPLLNRFTLGAASATFTVRTDKAQRHFGYRPAYTWHEARDRTAGWLMDKAQSQPG